ncbi:sigma-B regulation protein RsbU (phosphoserine phosphatase) [Streptomonospora nanhaiensis]|uniref:Sigma-B regulation protein RsbU (Phosphoserine phosphatase) n=1 Tax=Streptomonospora nanhaiensis TaxID=1323731 RepID=A0A853BRJ0_9ACTN|nr:SpoIIE family protein phosphatase [Streptomonospora nanhaiensis]NYI97111.1 sigma-B regulation protein RsbU (phosphoserine phosphatase) [Streptomonospora nanhaiensis]
MRRAGRGPEPAGTGGGEGGGPGDSAYAPLLEDSAEELYESAPCGYLSTLMDGTIVKANATLLRWLGRERGAVVGRLRFADLLTVGGRLYHETHFAPLLRMQGEVHGIALEIRTADGSRRPVLATSVVKTGEDGEPLLIRTTLTDARDRRSYETELLRARGAAEDAQRRAEEAQREAEDARRRAESDRARLQEALTVLQQSLLPDMLPTIPGLEAAAHYHTASPDQVGGDFYDLFPLGANRWGFFLGDVVGKGPEAATLTSLTRYTLRAAALYADEPTAALAVLNAVLTERDTGGDPRYCTALFGLLEREGAGFDVRLAGGGHPPAIAVRAEGGAEPLETPGGMVVGILPDAPFASARTRLAPGDSLLLYTDGLTEARVGGDRHLFGEDALRAFAAEHGRDGPQALVRALVGLLDDLGEGLSDDTALLCLGVPAAAAPAGGRSL